TEGGAGAPPLDGLDSGTQATLADCARCHGRDGLGRGNAAFPIIAGQQEAYLYQALRAYADGRRHSGIMQPAAARADDPALRALAAHYAAQPDGAAPSPEPEPEKDEILASGEAIARRGIPEAGVPACLACHGDLPNRNP